MSQIFDEVQKISKCGWFDMPMRSTFEINTQILLLKIDGFLKGWILNITPLKSQLGRKASYLRSKNQCDYLLILRYA